MIFRKLVRDIMSNDVVTLNAGDTIHDAFELMGENRISALPVVDSHNHCIGILSTSDLIDITRDVDEDVYQLDYVDPTSMRFLIDKLVHSMGSEPVQSFMSEVVDTISPESAIAQATIQMTKHRVHHLPVIDQDDQVVGIVSTMDLLAQYAAAAG